MISRVSSTKDWPHHPMCSNIDTVETWIGKGWTTDCHVDLCYSCFFSKLTMTRSCQCTIESPTITTRLPLTNTDTAEYFHTKPLAHVLLCWLDSTLSVLVFNQAHFTWQAWFFWVVPWPLSDELGTPPQYLLHVSNHATGAPYVYELYGHWPLDIWNQDGQSKYTPLSKQPIGCPLYSHRGNAIITMITTSPGSHIANPTCPTTSKAQVSDETTIAPLAILPIERDETIWSKAVHELSSKRGEANPPLTVFALLSPYSMKLM